MQRMALAFQSRRPTSLFRSFTTTPLFADNKPLSSGRPITFGQLVSPDLSPTTAMESPFPPPSCPCCAFLSGGGLFLPWNEEDTVDIDDGGDADSGRWPLPTEDIITPNEAWERISSSMGTATDDETHQKILLVDTHGHPHLQREVQYADETAASMGEVKCSPDGVISLTCAVSPLDWKDTLEYARQSPQILPALGVHPWYLGDIMVDVENSNTCDDVEQYLKWEWLEDLEAHLSEHPHLFVGEIGLCKMARFVREFPKDKGGRATALQLQKIVFRKQLELAAKWSRPVTVHCVNAHGIFMEVIKDILEKAKESTAEEDTSQAKKEWRMAFPPAIAMHSFTGTAHHVGEILAFEKELLYPEEVQAEGKRRRRKQQQQQQKEATEPEHTVGGEARDVLFYFGFSHAVNHIMCTSEKARKKGMEAVCSIPKDRLLVESDVHAAVDVALGTAGAVAYSAQVRGEPLEEVAHYTTKNGLRYLSSLGPLSV